MAIIAQPFEKLIATGNLGGKEFDSLRERGAKASIERLEELCDYASDLNKKWQIERVDNSEKRNFDITDDMRFVYRNTNGEEKERDITSYAFQQLCTRMGIPSQYLIKCQEAGKKQLVLDNFKAWSEDYNGTLQIMSNGSENTTRAVMTDGYERYDYRKILTNVRSTINLDKWTLVQSHLSEDMMVLRFVDASSPYYTDNNSQNYVMITLRTSDVGRAGLKIVLSSYRRVCSNGMIINNKRDGVLYSQPHAGKEMRDSKIVAFNRAFIKAENYGSAFAKGIENCRKEVLTTNEFDLWVEKAKRDMHLSKDSTEKLTDIVRNNYDRSIWGVTNGVTELAQEFTLDTRLDMEKWAGDVFASRM